MRTFSIRLIIKYPPRPVIFSLCTELLLIYHWNSSVLTFSFITKKVNFPLLTMPFQSITSILSHHWFYICTTLFRTDLYLKFTLSLRRFSFESTLPSNGTESILLNYRVPFTICFFSLYFDDFFPLF